MLQKLATQQGLNWEDVKKAAEASQHVEIQRVQAAPAAAGECRGLQQYVTSNLGYLPCPCDNIVSHCLLQ